MWIRRFTNNKQECDFPSKTKMKKKKKKKKKVNQRQTEKRMKWEEYTISANRFEGML